MIEKDILELEFRIKNNFIIKPHICELNGNGCHCSKIDYLSTKRKGFYISWLWFYFSLVLNFNERHLKEIK